MHQTKNQIKYFQKNEEYDLIYLYASLIVNYSEISKPINYRSEIKNIIKSSYYINFILYILYLLFL